MLVLVVAGPAGGLIGVCGPFNSLEDPKLKDTLLKNGFINNSEEKVKLGGMYSRRIKTCGVETFLLRKNSKGTSVIVFEVQSTIEH